MGNVFVKLRERYSTNAKDFTAKELSKKIGLSQKVISVLENKEKNGHEPTLTELKAYHAEFNVPYEYLLGETDSPTYENQTLSKELGLSESAINQLMQLKSFSDSMTEQNQKRFDPYGTMSLPLKALNVLLSNDTGSSVLTDIGLYLMSDSINGTEYCSKTKEWDITVLNVKNNRKYIVNMEKLRTTFLVDLQNDLAKIREGIEYQESQAMLEDEKKYIVSKQKEVTDNGNR